MVSSIADDNAGIGQALDNSGKIGADSQNRTVDPIITKSGDKCQFRGKAIGYGLAHALRHGPEVAESGAWWCKRRSKDFGSEPQQFAVRGRLPPNDASPAIER